MNETSKEILKGYIRKFEKQHLMQKGSSFPYGQRIIQDDDTGMIRWDHPTN
jgi:hypothetical protein